MNFDLHYSVMLTGQIERFAAEPLNACYLRPGKDGFRLMTEPLAQVLQLLEASPMISTATCILKSPSDRLLGFAYYPESREAAAAILSVIEPSFAIEAGDSIYEMTYLIDAANDEISAIREAIDINENDCKTAGMCLIPIRSGSLAEPWRATLDNGGLLKVHTLDEMMASISVFRM